MTFTRTNSGISNGHLFHGVDIIIYTEGGDISLSAEDVMAGEFNEKAVDIFFWKGLFKVAKFDKKAKFKAVGSKSASRHLREKVASGEVQNVAVAVDKDFDFVVGQQFESPKILYTNGYSWENDVYSAENTMEQASSYLQEVEVEEDVKQIVRQAYDDFQNVGKKLLRVEAIFRTHGKSFVTNIRGERYFDPSSSPYIQKAQIKSLLNSKKAEIDERPVKLEVDISGLCPVNHNYGKLVCALSRNVVRYIFKLKKAGNVTNAVYESNMIERFLNKQKKNMLSHYKKSIQRLEDALS